MEEVSDEWWVSERRRMLSWVLSMGPGLGPGLSRGVMMWDFCVRWS